MTTQSQGRNGEWRFGQDCTGPSSASDVIVNPSQDDQHGWDHILEFVPPQKNALPADLSTAVITTFVQVKTTIDKKPKTKLRLSNAVKAAKSPHPCFVFLYHYQEGQAPTLYGRHIWEDEIAHYLKRARKAGNAPLHKKSVTLTFTAADRVTCNPVDWVLAVLSTRDSLSYAGAKAEIVKTVGYGEDALQGTITFDASVSEKDIVLHDIGAREDLPFTETVLHDNRFGIRSQEPTERMTKGTVRLLRDGNPLTIELQSVAGDTLNFPAVGWAPLLHGPEHPEFRVRVKCGFIQFLFGRNHEPSLDFNFDVDQELPFLELLAFLTLIIWSFQGPVKFAFQSDFGVLAAGQTNGEWSKNDWALPLWQRAKLIFDILGEDRCASLSMPLRDLAERTEHLHELGQIATADAFKLERKGQGVFPEFSYLVGYSYGQFGEWAFAAIHELECRVRKFEDDTETLYFQRSTYPSTVAFKRSVEDMREKIQAEFEEYCQRPGYSCATYCDGDFVQWAQNLSKGIETPLHILGQSRDSQLPIDLVENGSSKP